MSNQPFYPEFQQSLELSHLAGIAGGLAERTLDPPGSYSGWLETHFPEVAFCPMAGRHRRLWNWFEELRIDQRPRPQVEVWPRGGGKSATAELGCAFIGARMTRRYVLYVSATQEQANQHVQTLSTFFERLRFRRALNEYGNSSGWRRSQLRTYDGFNVAAMGLDTSSRGAKIERYRPDLIIFDDIDSQGDTPAVVEKKLEAITRAILPMGSNLCAVLFLQNLIHEDGIVARLVDNRARFLLDRVTYPPEPAVRNLVTKIVQVPDGPNRYAIESGEPTWGGQPLNVCEEQINTWGLQAFLREAQHEVKQAGGYFFNADRFQIVENAPRLARVCLAWDLAATEGGGDHTVCVWLGITDTGVVYVLHVVRGQWSSEKVSKLVVEHAEKAHRLFSNYTIRIPQDPGQAGRAQADAVRRALAAYKRVRVVPVSGPKAARARGWAEKVNVGNVKLLKAEWNEAFIAEHAKFREDGGHLFDDQVDAASDAFSEVSVAGEARVSSMVRVNPLWGEDPKQ